MRDIRCILGFHNFKLAEVDDKFMPKMRIMIGECTRKECIEHELWFLNYETKRIFGGHGDTVIGFPMTKEDELAAEIK
jgi:hypothetical protein